VRRVRAVRPTFYAPNMPQPVQMFSGPLEAMEALYVATLNVASFGMMMAGGALWAFNIAGLDELRAITKKKVYKEEAYKGRPEEAVEGESDHWVTNVLMMEEKAKKKERAAGEGDTRTR
jgi:hypothetical protein